MIYNFFLTFKLPDGELDPINYIGSLKLNGCEDALIGSGELGKIKLDFSRKASSAVSAISSAINDVKRAIPGCILIEINPNEIQERDIESRDIEPINNFEILKKLKREFPDTENTIINWECSYDGITGNFVASSDSNLNFINDRYCLSLKENYNNEDECKYIMKLCIGTPCLGSLNITDLLSTTGKTVEETITQFKTILESFSSFLTDLSF